MGSYDRFTQIYMHAAAAAATAPAATLTAAAAAAAAVPGAPCVLQHADIIEDVLRPLQDVFSSSLHGQGLAEPELHDRDVGGLAEVVAGRIRDDLGQ